MCRYDTIVLDIDVNSVCYGEFTVFSETLNYRYIILIYKWIR